MPTWNKGHVIGQKPPLKPSEVWSIRTRLQVSGAVRPSSTSRSTASFVAAILSPCPLVTSRCADACEIAEQTRQALTAWIAARHLQDADFLFPDRIRAKPHISTRQYTRIVDWRTASIGLDPKCYGTHSLRRTKASQIYKKTGNIRAVQLLLGNTSWKAQSGISASTTKTH